MSENYFRNVVEAALLAAGRPLQLTELAQLFDESSRPEPDVLRAALDALEADYSSRGIEVKETATGFRIQVRTSVANEVSRLWPERPPRYSRALLETLALIAYRQPITRAEIEAVRGVAVNPNIIKTVLERNWVRVVGTRDVPGRPELLGTTKEFLDYFGLRALDELPALAELKAMGEINLQLDLAKPTDPSSDDGSGSEGSGGANGAGGGEGANGAGDGSGGSAVAAIGADDNGDGSVVAAIGAGDSGDGSVVAAIGAGDSGDGSVVAAIGVVAVAAAVASSDDTVSGDTASDADTAVNEAIAGGDVADAIGAIDASVADAVSAVDASGEAVATSQPTSAATSEPDNAEGLPSAARESATEAVIANDAAISDNSESQPVAVEESLAFEHEPVMAALTHVEVESDSGDVTVEVETLRFVEDRVEASIESDDVAAEPAPSVPAQAYTSIETGEFEMAELGITSRPAPIIEAEFDVDDLDSAIAEDDAADDEEELSAGPHSSTELVAAPRDRDD